VTAVQPLLRAPWQPPQPTDPLDIDVLAILRDGQVHDRHVLAVQVDCNVRQVRAAVSQLRQLGWPICLGPNGGYLLSWNVEDLDALERKYHSQALSQLRTLNRIRRMRRATGATMLDEPTIDELVRDKIETDYLLDR
jgi:hypothetical protein